MNHLGCAETQKRITPFIDWELNDEDAEVFIEHVDECATCREELAIQYLIAEGMKHLEDGSAFDLNKELKNRLGSSMVGIKKRRRFNHLMLSLQVVFVAMVAAFSFFIFHG